MHCLLLGAVRACEIGAEGPLPMGMAPDLTHLSPVLSQGSKALGLSSCEGEPGSGIGTTLTKDSRSALLLRGWRLLSRSAPRVSRLPPLAALSGLDAALKH